MPSPEINEFAKTLVQQVRDAAIQSSDRVLRPDVKHIIAKRWRQAATGGHAQLDPVATVLIPDIVDDTIFHLLHAIDQGMLKISFTASNGKVINLPEDGLSELAGWYMGGGGWRAMYSSERFVDDCADLNTWPLKPDSAD